MPQTLEATIDAVGHVVLNKKIRLNGTHNARVTILDEVKPTKNNGPEWSLIGSVEIIDEDLEAASREISDEINRAIEKSAEELTKYDN